MVNQCLRALGWLALVLMTITAVEAQTRRINMPTDGSTHSVDEGQAANTKVLMVSTSNPGSRTLSLVSVQDGSGTDRSSHFKMSGVDLVTNAILDFQAVPTYTIVIQADWTNGDMDQVTITVNVNDKDTVAPMLPSDPALYSTSFQEEQAANTQVFPPVSGVVDPDSTTFTFSLSGNHASYFDIDTSTGKITAKTQLDRDAPGAIKVFDDLKLHVADSAGNVGTPKALRVSLSDINDNAPICKPSMYDKFFSAVPSAGTTVVTISCTDADDSPNDIASYAIHSGDDSGGAKFATSGATILTSANPIDPGTRSSYVLVVHAVDGGSPSPKTGVATVTVRVATSTPPKWDTFSPPGPVYSISEDLAAGSLLVTLTATDADQGDAGTVEYFLLSAKETGTTNDKSSTFLVHPTSGQLRTASTLDYEAVTSYDAVVKAQDKASPPKSVTTTLTFKVLNVNDNDPAFQKTDHQVTIPETVARAGSWGGLRLTATDADTPGGTLQFTVSEVKSGTANKFGFSSSTPGLLEQKSAVDVDSPTGDAYSYMLTVRVSDGGVPGSPERYGYAMVSITITPHTNDHTPIFGTPSPPAPTLSETVSIGTTVSTVTVTDKDRYEGKPQTVTYSITQGNTNDAFAIDPVRGVVTTNKALDYETTDSYVLTVRAADSGAPVRSAEYSLKVTITNANENRPTCLTYTLVATVVEGGSAQQVVAPSCSDADRGDTLMYSIVPPVSPFTINNANGMVSTLSGLDYEAVTSYALTVEVSDSVAPRFTATVKLTVHVKPVNEFDPVFSPASHSKLLPEDSPAGTSVVTVTATDRDRGLLHGTIRYSIVAGNDLLAFAIDSSSGKMTTTAAGLDREQGSGVYTLTVRASDDVPGAASERTADVTVVVTLTDVNDNTPMCNPVNYQARVMEPSKAGATVLTVTVRDDDKAGTPFATPTLSVTGGNTGSVFGVQGLNLVLLKEVNYEVVTFYSLTLTVKDGGTPALSSTCKAAIAILSAAEHPPKLAKPNESITLAENTAPGTKVFDADANDTDVGAGSSVSYSIISGDATNDFFCFPTTGEVIVWNQLDYDTLPRAYNLTIEAKDDGGLRDTMWLHVALTDLNDEVPVFRHNVYRRALQENVANGSHVITVTADDRDSGLNGAVTYTAISGNGLPLFHLDSGTGVITTKAALDRETRAEYSLVVQAADRGSPALSSTALVVVRIADVNDHTPAFTPVRFTVALSESAGVGAHVTNVTARDGDATAPNNVMDYHFTHTHFQLSAAGAMTTRQTLDREATGRYVLRVLAIDRGAPSRTGTATVTVVINDVNDNTPVISGTYVREVSEGADINTVVATIAATDADVGENARLTYVIVDGNANGAFVISEENGILQVAKGLDREGQAFYSLKVEVRDNGNPQRTAATTVNITVTDVNDNRPVWDKSPYTFSLTENVPRGTTVGKVSATDADLDVSAALTYSVVLFWTGNVSHFTVDGASGVIKTDAMLDRESIASYKALLRVTDGGNPKLHSDVNVTIVINDVNDNSPVLDQRNYNVTITENEAVGTEVVVMTVSDADAGVNADVTLSIDNSTEDGRRAVTFFEVSNTGKVTVKKVVDRETDPSFRFVILAADGGTPSRTSSASVVITVNDVNDNAPVFTRAYYNTEIAYFGHCSKSIVTLTATDADTGVRGQVSYFLESTNMAHLFGVNSQTGEFHTQSATYPSNALHLVRVVARDGGTPSLTSPTPALVRVDAMVPEEVVLNFQLGISADAFRARQQTFLLQLQGVMRQRHPSAMARLWCVTSQSDGGAHVHVYFLKDNSTESVANSNSAKVYVTQSEARGVFTSDLAGTPGSVLTGAEWAPYDIRAVQPYSHTASAWHETREGVAFIVLASVLGFLLLGLLTYMLLCRGRCRPGSYYGKKAFKPRPPVDRRPPARKPVKVRAQPEEPPSPRKTLPSPRPPVSYGQQGSAWSFWDSTRVL